MQRVAHTIERIERIQWQSEDTTRYGSNIRLLCESAIRFARWSQHVPNADDTRSCVFFDLAGCLDPKCGTPEYSNPNIENWIALRVIPWILKWESLQEKTAVKIIEPDPFEPFLLCLERGGRPFTEHGFLHIEHSTSFPYGYGQWPDQFLIRTPADITDRWLDELDHKFSAKFNTGG